MAPYSRFLVTKSLETLYRAKGRKLSKEFIERLKKKLERMKELERKIEELTCVNQLIESEPLGKGEFAWWESKLAKREREGKVEERKFKNRRERREGIRIRGER